MGDDTTLTVRHTNSLSTKKLPKVKIQDVCHESFEDMNPAGIYPHKVNRNTRTRHEICLKLTMKTPSVILGSLLLTLNIIHTLF